MANAYTYIKPTLSQGPLLVPAQTNATRLMAKSKLIHVHPLITHTHRYTPAPTGPKLLELVQGNDTKVMAETKLIYDGWAACLTLASASPALLTLNLFRNVTLPPAEA